MLRSLLEYFFTVHLLPFDPLISFIFLLQKISNFLGCFQSPYSNKNDSEIAANKIALAFDLQLDCLAW
jgi:hypothetical protein